MTEFSTSGSVRIEVDEGSLRQARNTVEQEIGSVRVDAAAATDGGTAGAMVDDAAMVDELSDQSDLLEDILDEMEEGGGLGGGGGGGASGGAGGGGVTDIAGDYLQFRGLQSALGKAAGAAGGSGLLARVLGSTGAIAGAGGLGGVAMNLPQVISEYQEGDRLGTAEATGEAGAAGAFGYGGGLLGAAVGGPVGAAVGSTAGALVGGPAYDATSDALFEMWDPETTAADAASGNPDRDVPGLEQFSPTNPSPTNIGSWLSNINAPSTEDLTSDPNVDMDAVDDAIASIRGSGELNRTLQAATGGALGGIAGTGGSAVEDALGPGQRAQRTADRAQQTAESIQNMDVTVDIGGVNVQNETNPDQLTDEVLRQARPEVRQMLREMLHGGGAELVSEVQRGRLREGF